MDVLMMARQLILAREAVAAAVLAPNPGAWVLLRVSAMLDGVMADEIGPSFAGEWADQLDAAECRRTAYFVEMASFVEDVIAVALGEKGAAWEPAGHAVIRPIFESADGETCDAGACIAWFSSRSISNDRFHVRLGVDPCVRHPLLSVDRVCLDMIGDIWPFAQTAFHAL